MEFKSFESLGIFHFSDSLKAIKAKLGKDIQYDESESHHLSLEKMNKFLYVEKYKLSIIFHENKKSISFIEIEKGKFIFNDIDLFKVPYIELLNKFQILDENLKADDESGFESKKFGFGVTRNLHNGKYSKHIKSAFAMSLEYLDRPIPTGDDILMHYLGYNPFDE